MTQLYKIFNDQDEIIYIGVGESADKRVRSHREKWWGHEIARYEIEEVGSRDRALLIEAEQIRAHAPKYNRAHNPGHPSVPGLVDVVRRGPRPRNETKARYVSVSDAAEYIGASTKFVRNLIVRGDLTGYRVGSRSIRVDVREVEALLVPIPTVGTMRAGGRR